MARQARTSSGRIVSASEHPASRSGQSDEGDAYDAPIGRGTAAEGPFGKRLGPPKVVDRSQRGARAAVRHPKTTRGESRAGPPLTLPPRPPPPTSPGAADGAATA